MASLPVIDISPLLSQEKDSSETISSIGRACRDHGFFYISNHGVSDEICKEAFANMKKFFQLPSAEKKETHLKNVHSYHGYFSMGEEKTDFQVDLKEGVYIFPDFPADHPEVVAKNPLCGSRQWPREELVPGFKDFFTNWVNIMTDLSYVMMTAIAQSLGTYFDM